jgi:uncharacterized protein (TIGR02246 family)
MLRVRSIAAVLLALIALPATVSQAFAEPAIELVEAAWAKAMEANDIEAVMACYAEDAVLWAPDSPKAVGTAQIRATFAGMFGMFTIMDIQMLDVRYKTTGDVSLAWGTFVLTMMPKAGGDPITMTGRFTEVAEKRDGKWVFTVDHASADPTPVPETKAAPMPKK